MALAVAFVHASQIGAPPVQAAPLPPPKPPGFLRVVVDPWAEIYVDGKYTDTTPFDKALSIPEGDHKIEFKNPFFNAEKRSVHIKRGVTATVKVELARK
jgi:hypothetical protein